MSLLKNIRKIGNTLIGSFDDGSSIQLNPPIKNQIRVRGGASNGSGSTAIQEFTTVTENIGSAITRISTSVLGDSFTINESGIYAITYSANFGGGTAMGITLNSASLSTDIQSVANPDERLAITWSVSAAANGFTSWTGYLNAGDVIRGHNNVGSTNSTTGICHFSIAKIG